jgi:hypothetical protein
MAMAHGLSKVATAADCVTPLIVADVADAVGVGPLVPGGTATVDDPPSPEPHDPSRTAANANTHLFIAPGYRWHR